MFASSNNDVELYLPLPVHHLEFNPPFLSHFPYWTTLPNIVFVPIYSQLNYVSFQPSPHPFSRAKFAVHIFTYARQPKRNPLNQPSPAFSSLLQPPPHPPSTLNSQYISHAKITHFTSPHHPPTNQTSLDSAPIPTLHQPALLSLHHIPHSPIPSPPNTC